MPSSINFSESPLMSAISVRGKFGASGESQLMNTPDQGEGRLPQGALTQMAEKLVKGSMGGYLDSALNSALNNSTAKAGASPKSFSDYFDSASQSSPNVRTGKDLDSAKRPDAMGSDARETRAPTEKQEQLQRQEQATARTRRDKDEGSARVDQTAASDKSGKSEIGESKSEGSAQEAVTVRTGSQAEEATSAAGEEEGVLAEQLAGVSLLDSRQSTVPLDSFFSELSALIDQFDQANPEALDPSELMKELEALFARFDIPLEQLVSEKSPAGTPLAGLQTLLSSLPQSAQTQLEGGPVNPANTFSAAGGLGGGGQGQLPPQAAAILQQLSLKGEGKLSPEQAGKFFAVLQQAAAPQGASSPLSGALPPMLGATTLQPGAQSTANYVTSIQSPLQSAQFKDAMGQKLVWFVGQKIQNATVHLNPVELGPIDMQIKMQKDQVQVQIHAAHPVVRDLLENTTHRLRDLLSEQGIELAQFNVSDQSGQQSTGSGDQQTDQEAVNAGLEQEEEVKVVEQLLELDQLVDYYA